MSCLQPKLPCICWIPQAWISVLRSVFNALQLSPHARLHDKLLKRTAKEGAIFAYQSKVCLGPKAAVGVLGGCLPFHLLLLFSTPIFQYPIYYHTKDVCITIWLYNGILLVYRRLTRLRTCFCLSSRSRLRFREPVGRSPNFMKIQT